MEEKINRGDTAKQQGRQFFLQEKIGVTPSVAAPGDTHHSDATACKALRYGTRFQGVSQFYLHTLRSSATE